MEINWNEQLKKFAVGTVTQLTMTAAIITAVLVLASLLS